MQSGRSPSGCPAQRAWDSFQVYECTWVEMWTLIANFLPVSSIPLGFWRKWKLYMPLQRRIHLVWGKWHCLSADLEDSKLQLLENSGRIFFTKPQRKGPCCARQSFVIFSCRALGLGSPGLWWPHMQGSRPALGNWEITAHGTIFRLNHYSGPRRKPPELYLHWFVKSVRSFKK